MQIPWAIGLMSGTSLDGIDAALVRTDGIEVAERGPWLTLPLEDALRAQLRALTYGEGDAAAIENILTRKYAEAVKQLLAKAGMTARDISVIGMHGQTINHRPEQGITLQIGNGSLLAELTHIDVVADFRRRDVAAGGQGAPLVPLYHAALAKDHTLPVAFINLGGIANVTWIGRSETRDSDLLSLDIMAFDTGPGNVLLNEWCTLKLGKPMDEGGMLALSGQINKKALEAMLKDPYFLQSPPKSLDRNYFTLKPVQKLSKEDGAATLSAFTAAAIAQGVGHFPAPPIKWYITGGGRHNPAIMDALKLYLGQAHSVEEAGWEGDAMEAQAFAYLAVRSLKGLALSLPTTTGASRAVTGGAFYRA